MLEYILEAAREGYKMNWTRFCEETGLTRETFLSIQNAVSKVGKEKLKPIKTELPEEVRSTLKSLILYIVRNCSAGR